MDRFLPRRTPEKVRDTHVERVMRQTTGEWTSISCDCAIGRDHTYAEWVARFDRAPIESD